MQTDCTASSLTLVSGVTLIVHLSLFDELTIFFQLVMVYVKWYIVDRDVCHFCSCGLIWCLVANKSSWMSLELVSWLNLARFNVTILGELRSELLFSKTFWEVLDIKIAALLGHLVLDGFVL